MPPPGCVHTSKAFDAHWRVYTTEVCASPGRVNSKEAWAVPGSVYSTPQGPEVLLDNRSCTWACLERGSLYSTAPGRIYANRWISPGFNEKSYDIWWQDFQNVSNLLNWFGAGGGGGMVSNHYLTIIIGSRPQGPGQRWFMVLTSHNSPQHPPVVFSCLVYTVTCHPSNIHTYWCWENAPAAVPEKISKNLRSACDKCAKYCLFVGIKPSVVLAFYNDHPPSQFSLERIFGIKLKFRFNALLRKQHKERKGIWFPKGDKLVDKILSKTLILCTGAQNCLKLQG